MNTSSDWQNHTIQPIRNFVTFKFTKFWRKNSEYIHRTEESISDVKSAFCNMLRYCCTTKLALNLNFNLTFAQDEHLLTEHCILPCLLLTHSHTMPDFDTLKICSGGKHCEKRRNYL